MSFFIAWVATCIIQDLAKIRTVSLYIYRKSDHPKKMKQPITMRTNSSNYWTIIYIKDDFDCSPPLCPASITTFLIKSLVGQEAVRTSLAHVLVQPMFSAKSRALIHEADGRLTARSRQVSKPRDSSLDFSNRSEIWQAHRQQRCRDARQC